MEELTIEETEYTYCRDHKHHDRMRWADLHVHYNELLAKTSKIDGSQ